MLPRWTGYIKKFTENLPLIAILYFSVAFIYLQSYYYAFDINVVDYFGYSEIFLPLVFPIFLIALVVSFFILRSLMMNAFFYRNPVLSGYTLPPRLERFFNPIRKFVKAVLLVSGILTYLGIFALLIWTVYKFGLSVLSALIFLLLVYSGVPVIGKVEQFKKFRQSIISVVVLLIICIIIMLRFLYARQIKEKGATEVLSASYKGKVFTSDRDSLLFIGTSNEYYFFYNRKQDNTLIIQRKEMDSVTIKQNGSFNIENYLTSGLK